MVQRAWSHEVSVLERVPLNSVELGAQRTQELPRLAALMVVAAGLEYNLTKCESEAELEPAMATKLSPIAASAARWLGIWDPAAPILIADIALNRLVNAVRARKYDPERASIRSYARGFIRMVALQLRRGEIRNRLTPAGYVPLQNDIACPVETAANNELMTATMIEIHKLPPADQDLLYRRFGALFGKTGTECIARWTPREYVRLHRLLRRLRLRLSRFA